MSRRTLTDEQWARIGGHLPGRAGRPGRSGVDNRLFVDAILWMAGNAARWRDLPEVFGKWSGVHARFRRRSRAGVWERLFHSMADTPDFEYVLIDSTISKIHADASGAGGAEVAAIGRSRGRLTIKLHAAVDAIGLPIRIHPTPGQRGDAPQAETLLKGLKGVGHVIADAAYNADPLRALLADNLGATGQIKANPSRTRKPPIDWRLYKERHHQVECFFDKLKRFRRIARRCEKTVTTFMGFVHLACAMIWLR